MCGVFDFITLNENLKFIVPIKKHLILNKQQLSSRYLFCKNWLYKSSNVKIEML